MFKQLILAVGLIIATTATQAGPLITSMEIQCNWGTLTVTTAGRTLGQHSSDPAGDGLGPDGTDQPRAGLANVFVQGSLETTCLMIADTLGL